MLYDLHKGRDSRPTSDKLYTVKVDILGLQIVPHLRQQVEDGLEDGLADLLELRASHRVLQIALVHKILDVKVVLSVSREDLPLPLDLLHQLDDRLLVLADIAPARGLLEDSPVEFIEVIVDISAPNVPVVLLVEHIHLGVGEPAGEGAELGVAEVEEKDVSGVSSIEVRLSEHTIVESNSS